jgi:hypothetical protein
MRKIWGKWVNPESIESVTVHDVSLRQSPISEFQARIRLRSGLDLYGPTREAPKEAQADADRVAEAL